MLLVLVPVSCFSLSFFVLLALGRRSRFLAHFSVMMVVQSRSDMRAGVKARSPISADDVL